MNLIEVPSINFLNVKLCSSVTLSLKINVENDYPMNLGSAGISFVSVVYIMKLQPITTMLETDCTKIHIHQNDHLRFTQSLVRLGKVK